MGMVIGAVFSCLALRKYGAEKVRTNLLNHPNTGLPIGKRFSIGATIICPILAVIMFLWWCVLSVGWNPDWWNPLGIYSLGTMVVQLGGAGLVLWIFNNKIAESAGPKVFDGENYPDVVDNGFN